MTKYFVSSDDIRRVNDRCIGRSSKVALSAEDAAFFERLKRMFPSIKDSPKLRQSWKEARAV